MSHTNSSSANYSQTHKYALNRKVEAADVLPLKRAALPNAISLPASSVAASSKSSAANKASPRQLPRIPHGRESQEPLIIIPNYPTHSYRNAEMSASNEAEPEAELELEADLSIPTTAASPSLSPNRAPKVVYFTQIPGRKLSFTPYDPSRGAVRQQKTDPRRGRAWRRKIQERVRRALRKLRRFLEWE